MTQTKLQQLYGQTLLFLIVLIFLLPAQAQNFSPVGYWQTVSDRTGTPAGVVQITENNGILSGKIVAIFRQDGNKPTDRCVKCTGPRYYQPIMGMTVIWGLHNTDVNEWSGGQILDPKIGKVYRCKLQVFDNGNYMRVRGYIGISLFGRTQTWMRIEPLRLSH